MEPLYRKDQNLFTDVVLISRPGYSYCILKVPFYLFERHMHKDIVLESVLFTLSINI